MHRSFRAVLMFLCSLSFVVSCKPNRDAKLQEDRFVATTAMCQEFANSQYFERLSQALAVEEQVWKNMDIKDFVLLVTQKDRQGALVLAIEGNYEQLLARPDIMPCEGLPHLLQWPQTPTTPANGLFHFVAWTSGEGWPYLRDAYLQMGLQLEVGLADALQTPIITMHLDEEVFSQHMDLDTYRVFWVSAAVHEAFHAHQSWPDPELPAGLVTEVEFDRDNWLSCPAEWSKNVLTLFDKSLAAIPELANLDRKEAVKLAQKLLALRNSNDPLSQTCWHYWGAWERIEGSAQYFEYEVLLKTGLLNWEMISEGAQEFRPESWPATEGGEAEFFYITGAVLAQLLKVIDSSGSWQTEVASGALLHEALAKRLSQ